DIAVCYFKKNESKWEAEIIAGETIPYDEEWKNRLRIAPQLSGLDLTLLDIRLGQFFGEEVNRLMSRLNIRAEFIASHGHTVFHQPSEKITLQIGRGASLAATTGMPVVCDFRSLDVASGGQGAPLVPVGDALLFGQFDFCLNIGGIANISFDFSGIRQAFDICPANMILDLIAQRLGKKFDPHGEIAATGEVNQPLLTTLNSLSYYSQDPPKSLGREWFESNFYPLVFATSLSEADLLATCSEHIALQTASVLDGWTGDMLITGGGAWNTDLIRRLQKHTAVKCIVPDPMTVNFKEALVFAFLGVLRWVGEINTLSGVTGAKVDSCGGAIYLPPRNC
ncbi:MAG: anhydro-N-acetylmuramic acid kinase, partial [Crocinitomicaceae bacterium]|nr:anhydro-N-acetylmuramic acid kinase [Crocinitomicaceae bacterium]